MTICPYDILHSPFHFVNTKTLVGNQKYAIILNLCSTTETVEEAVVKSIGYALDA